LAAGIKCLASIIIATNFSPVDFRQLFVPEDDEPLSIQDNTIDAFEHHLEAADGSTRGIKMLLCRMICFNWWLREQLHIDTTNVNWINTASYTDVSGGGIEPSPFSSTF
jgi:hypothetical protein